MNRPNLRIESRRLMLRALHALVRAQLRQRDYLELDEFADLKAVEAELQAWLRPEPDEEPRPVYYCSPCRAAQHANCLGADCHCAFRHHEAFESYSGIKFNP